MLKVGDRAPDFTARTTDGRELALSSLRGRPVVIYFFPKAFTSGCTLETKRFRDAYPELQGLGAEILGVSSDPHERQCAFAESLAVGFPMIGDAGHAIGNRFGVVWPVLGFDRRITFVLDGEGVVRGVFGHELMVNKHLDDTRALLRTLAAERGARKG